MCTIERVAIEKLLAAHTQYTSIYTANTRMVVLLIIKEVGNFFFLGAYYVPMPSHIKHFNQLISSFFFLFIPPFKGTAT